MSVRIQLRRDTAAAWAANNPVLKSGEIGIEIDTFKMKVGNGVARWNSIPGYIMKPGMPNGVATLGSTGKIQVSQLPDQISITDEVAAAVNAITVSTTNVSEGTNKYFTDQRAIDANAQIIADAIFSAESYAQAKADLAKTEAISASETYTDLKVDEAKTSAIALAGVNTENKINQLSQTIPSTVSEIVSSSISTEVSNRNTAINTAISNEITNRNTAINNSVAALNTSTIAEGTNKYFTAQRAKDAVASDISAAIAAIPAPVADFTGKTTDDLPEGTTNKYFTNAKAISALSGTVTNILQYVQDSVDSISAGIGTNISNALVDYIPVADRNVANGVAGLDASGKILDSAVPSTVAKLAGADFTGDLSTTNLTVTGNLTVNGTTTTVNSTNLELTDSMIYLGSGNTGNSHDIGIVGHFTSGGYQHTGLVRDASDGKWKLFSGVSTEPSSDALDFTSAIYDTLKVGAIETSSATIGNVSDIEIQFLDGVTSSIQTQIDSKSPIASPTFTGTVTIPSGANISGYLKSDIAAATYMRLDADLLTYIDLTSYVKSSDLATTYLNKTDAASTYLSKYDASASYLTQTNAASTYLSKSDALSTYATASALSTVSSTATTALDNANNALVYGYHNSKNGITTQNKISYGTSATPDISSPVAGDIYIQY